MNNLLKNLMRIFIPSLLLFLVLISSQGYANKPVVAKLLHKENLSCYSVPGFLVRSAMLFSSETRKMRPALKGISSFNISVSDNVYDSNSVFTRINNGLKTRNYETLMEIVDNESKITIKTLENNGKIREIVVLICENSSFISVSMKGSICPENILKVVTTFADNQSMLEV